MLVLGLHSKDRKFTRDKAYISYPKVHRGCPPLTAKCISADCVQISLGPSIQYIPLRVYHTGGFNAMHPGFSIHPWTTTYPMNYTHSPCLLRFTINRFFAILLRQQTRDWWPCTAFSKSRLQSQYLLVALNNRFMFLIPPALTIQV